jgi:hypothetical protein
MIENGGGEGIFNRSNDGSINNIFSPKNDEFFNQIWSNDNIFKKSNNKKPQISTKKILNIINDNMDKTSDQLGNVLKNALQKKRKRIHLKKRIFNIKKINKKKK